MTFVEGCSSRSPVSVLGVLGVSRWFPTQNVFTIFFFISVVVKFENKLTVKNTCSSIIKVNRKYSNS